MSKRAGVNLCGKCSQVHCRPIWADDEHKGECLFRGAGAEEAAASKDDDNDEEPAPVQPPTPEQMSAAWTADDIVWTSRQVKFTQLGWPLVGMGVGRAKGPDAP